MTSTVVEAAAKSPTTTAMSTTKKKSPTRAEPARLASIGPAALVTARWSLLAVGAGLVLAQLGRPGLWGERPLGGTWAPLGVVALWGLFNGAAGRTARRGAPAEQAGRAGRDLIWDVGFLTALLALTGGANNPFTMLYFVPITLATLVSRSWTSLVALASVCGFAALVLVSTFTMEGAGAALHGAHDAHAHHAHHGAGSQYWRHLVGMGVALAVAGSLVTYFVHKIAGVLSAQREELERLRREAREDRYAASLGALSAGAAHELGTPLGTIQLLAGELEWMQEDERREAAALMRRELERCKDILHGMKNPELSARALEAGAPWSVEELSNTFSSWELGSGTKLVVRTEPGVGRWHQPRQVLEQTVRELITNAERAACEDRPLEVEVSVAAAGDELRVSVRDNGRGMDDAELAAACEPFFSTRPDGRGLGLFLARLHLRQLGGALELESTPGRGTVAELRLPRTPPGWFADHFDSNTADSNVTAQGGQA